MSYQTETLTIHSAELLPRELAPPDYKPVAAVDAPLVYDDEVDNLDPGPWRRFYNSGGNGIYYVRADRNGDAFFVEHDMVGYHYTTPDDSGLYANAYDAFYAAEQAMATTADSIPAQ